MKTVCIYHSIDLDGWMSAAIVKHWWKLNNIQSIVEDRIDVLYGPEKESLEFIGYNYGHPIPDLSEYDKVIMCDISFSRDIMIDLLNRLDTNFLWIDHHVSAIKDIIGIHNILNADGTDISTAFNGLRNIKFAACELTWQFFFPNEPVPEIVRLLGMYDSFRHRETNEEQKVLEFQYGARQLITKYEDAYNYLCAELKVSLEDRFSYVIEPILKSGKSIYQYLYTEAKQNLEHSFLIKIGNYNFRCINKIFNPSAFNLEYDEDGFATFIYSDSKKTWTFTLYTNKENIDCSIIAQQFGGGGHKQAAGMNVDTETMLKFFK